MRATLEPPADFADPRLDKDFDATAWPLCNGIAAPAPGAADLYERRCLEFLATYYRLNRLNQRLLAARNKRAGKERIRSILSAINKSVRALEKMEDRYAPIGFYGEPVMAGVFYRDIAFARPDSPRIYPSPASYSSQIAIPGLEDIPASELRGTARIIRFGHGKVDL
jgi:hypothetical protein